MSKSDKVGENKARITITIDRDVLEAVELRAKALRRSISSMVNYVLAHSQGMKTKQLEAIDAETDR
jgi:hypothetical protein